MKGGQIDRQTKKEKLKRSKTGNEREERGIKRSRDEPGKPERGGKRTRTSTRNMNNERCVYLVLKMDTVQKHKVKQTKKLWQPLRLCKVIAIDESVFLGTMRTPGQEETLHG